MLHTKINQFDLKSLKIKVQTSQSVHFSQLDLSPCLHHVKRQRQDRSDLDRKQSYNGQENNGLILFIYIPDDAFAAHSWTWNLFSHILSLLVATEVRCVLLIKASTHSSRDGSCSEADGEVGLINPGLFTQPSLHQLIVKPVQSCKYTQTGAVCTLISCFNPLTSHHLQNNQDVVFSILCT